MSFAERLRGRARSCPGAAGGQHHPLRGIAAGELICLPFDRAVPHVPRIESPTSGPGRMERQPEEACRAVCGSGENQTAPRYSSVRRCMLQVPTPRPSPFVGRSAGRRSVLRPLSLRARSAGRWHARLTESGPASGDLPCCDTTTRAGDGCTSNRLPCGQQGCLGCAGAFSGAEICLVCRRSHCLPGRHWNVRDPGPPRALGCSFSSEI
jgi:hypothetical protein